MGLLDSGSTRTILGCKGVEIAKELGVEIKSMEASQLTVANGQTCKIAGSCELPIVLKGRLCVVEVLLVPEVPHLLVLGWDFWKNMKIVPMVNEWKFTDQPPVLDAMEHAQTQSDLSETEKQRLQGVINRNVALMGQSLGCTTLAEHVIVTDSPPIKQRYYRVSPVMQAIIDEEINKMLDQGIIEKSNSPWASPLIMVKKKDGTYRPCVDFRKLNAVTKRDSYPLPMVADTLDKLKDAQYLSSLDLKSAYWQVPMAEASKEYTAFTVPNRGLFQFRRMPFGLHNSPSTWQRLIDRVLGADLEPFVFVYLDDVVIVTPTFEKHLEVLEEVFRRLREAHLTVSLEKCQFCRPSMKYLGYVVDRFGLHVDPDKVKAMLDIPSPKSVTEVRRVVGVFSWYRRFIPEFSSIVAPITGLLRKSQRFVWSMECEEAFRRMKNCLVSAPVLNCPDYTLPFVIQADASGFGIGAVLTQPHPDGERVICYLSRSLSKAERNYSTTERECLAVLYAVEKFRPYILGIPFTVITDHHSLVWLQNLKDPTGRLARWAVRLQQYDFKIIHRKGKEHIVPDALSRSVPILDAIAGDEQRADAKCEDAWYRKMLVEVDRYPIKFSNWRVSEGVLHKRVKVDYPTLAEPGDDWRIVVPKNERHNRIIEAHNPSISGHLGVYKTYARLAEKYFWPKMRYDVTRFVKKCEVCASHKPQKTLPEGMASHPKADRPWEVISSDLMGPLPRSSKGNQFILVITDYLSKFSVIVPLRKATAAAVAREIEEKVFLLFGVPRVLICDNGPQYRSKEFQKLTSDYQVTVKYTPYYHPRANPTERVNRTLKTMMAMYVTDNHRKWDAELPRIACALRTARHEVTKLTPYYVNFGRNMFLSGNDYNRPLIAAEEEGKTPAETRNSALGKLFKDVRHRLEVAAKHTTQRYNLRKRYDELKPGQPVWKKNFVLSAADKYFSKKLAPKYVGPFYVHQKISPWVYQLKDSGGKVLEGSWHARDLKRVPDIDDV